MTFDAAAVAQTATGRPGNRAQMPLGIGAEAAGLLVVAVGMEATNLAAFLIGGGLAGAGAGVAVQVGAGQPARLGRARQERRGGRRAISQTAMLFFAGVLLVILALIDIAGIETGLTVAGGRIVYASDRYEGQEAPLPPIAVEWSPIVHFGGHQNVPSGARQAYTFVEAAADSAEQTAWRRARGEHIHDHGDGPLDGCA